MSNTVTFQAVVRSGDGNWIRNFDSGNMRRLRTSRRNLSVNRPI